MKIYKLTTVTEPIVKAFDVLIPQLAPDCAVPRKKELEALANSDHTSVFIAEEDQDILGTLTLVWNKIPTGDKIWIEDVVVDKAARGKGIGKALIQFAVAYVKEHHGTSINLTSSPERIAANQLYQNLGFAKRETNVYRLNMKKDYRI